MTNMTRSISDWLAPVLVAAGMVLVAANWYLQPDRSVVWAVVTALFLCMAWAVRVDSRRVRDGAERRPGRSLREGVVLSGLIMVLCLGGVLARKLGLSGDNNLSWRGTMILLGLFFVITGNTVPKVLPPLSSMPENESKAQACRRSVGWTWVMTGLVFTACWLVLPVAMAETLSMPLLVAGMITVATQIARLRWSRHKEA